MTDDREVFKVRREAGLKARHEMREDRFHERVREVIAEGLTGMYINTSGQPRRVDISPVIAETIAPAAYQALLDAGYVVIPASEASA